jgi:hypothetical protein
MKRYFRQHLKIHHVTIKKVDLVPKAKNRTSKFNMSVLREFLERDDNSRLTSGKKETVSRGRQKRQIRYLNFPFQVLYEKFLSEQAGASIGKSAFYNYNKKFPHIRQSSVNSREQCLCQKCTNVQVCSYIHKYFHYTMNILITFILKLIVDALYTNKVLAKVRPMVTKSQTDAAKVRPMVTKSQTDAAKVRPMVTKSQTDAAKVRSTPYRSSDTFVVVVNMIFEISIFE